MSLLDKVLSTARKPELIDGIHENCILLSATNEVKKNKNNENIARNCYTRFGQIDKNGKVIAETEISWYDLVLLPKNRYNNFFDQLDQMTNIVTELIGEENDFETKVNTVLEEYEIEKIDDIKELLETMKNGKKFLTGLYEAYIETLQAYLSAKGNVLVRIKLVYDSKGKNIQHPSYGPIIEKMSVKNTALVITEREKQNKAKSLNPTAAPTASANISNI